MSFNKSFNLMHSIRLLVFLLIYFANIFAQSGNFRFDYISLEQTSAQSTVFCMLEDSDGFMWFGTEAGLIRYDGYNFRVFKNFSGDKSTNFVNSLYQDRSGRFWIATSNSPLIEYDPVYEKFKEYKIQGIKDLTSINITAVIEDSNEMIWLGTEKNGILIFNPATGKYSRKVIGICDSLNDNIHIRSFVFDKKGNLWIGTNGFGLIKYNPIDGSKNVFTNENTKEILPHNIVSSLGIDSNDRIWIGTDNGFCYYQNKIRPASDFFSNGNLTYPVITSLVTDNKDRIWIGTLDGLNVADLAERTVHRIRNDLDNPNSLSHNTILCLYKSRNDIVWIGESEGNINKYDPRHNIFSGLWHRPSDPKGLPRQEIRSVFMDEVNLLWIGTLGGGLHIYDINSKSYLHSAEFKIDGEKPVVSAIASDSDGGLFIGTWGKGLIYANKSAMNNFRKSFNFSHIVYSNVYRNSNMDYSLSNDAIQTILKDSKGNIWIGTDDGLNILIKESNNFLRIGYKTTDFKLSDQRIQSNSICEDKFGNIWVGTWNGLNLILNPGKINEFNFRKLNIIPYTTSDLIPDANIISLAYTGGSVIYAGTHGGGLLKIEFSKNEILNTVSFTAENGLANDVVYNILPESESRLWLSTFNGLSLYNSDSGVFRNFYKEDGLLNNKYYWGAAFKSKDGRMFFGGTSGLDYFHPSEIKANSVSPKIYITGFQLFNSPVDFTSENSPLEHSIIKTKEIALSYMDYVFTFEFAAIDFSNPAKVKYKYFLEGFDKNWIESGSRRYATYTNLDPGTYTFRVKASNSYGYWGNGERVLTLIIKPPFWKTWWFIMLVVLSIIGIAYIIITLRFKHLIALERLRADIAADLHDNIGSGLTEISIISEVLNKLIGNSNPNASEYLIGIAEKSRSLVGSMSDTVWLINPRRDSLYDMLQRLKDNTKDILAAQGITMNTNNKDDFNKVFLPLEHRQNIYLIFKEAINNSIKHSSADKMELTAEIWKKQIKISFYDNGKGFDTTGRYEGNGLYNIKKRAAQIGGELEIVSGKEYGTNITFIGSI